MAEHDGPPESCQLIGKTGLWWHFSWLLVFKICPKFVHPYSLPWTVLARSRPMGQQLTVYSAGHISWESQMVFMKLLAHKLKSLPWQRSDERTIPAPLTLIVWKEQFEPLSVLWKEFWTFHYRVNNYIHFTFCHLSISQSWICIAAGHLSS